VSVIFLVFDGFFGNGKGFFTLEFLPIIVQLLKDLHCYGVARISQWRGRRCLGAELPAAAIGGLGGESRRRQRSL